MSQLIDMIDQTQRSNRILAGVLTRFVGYTVVLFGLLLLVPQVASSGGQKAFDEGGAIEWFQTGAIATSAFLFCCGAIRYQTSRPLLTGLCAVSAVATVREQDSILNDLLPSLEWPGVAAIIVGIGFTLLWRRRADFVRQASLFSSTTAYGLLWVGFVAVVAFSQLAGDHRIWQIFLPTDLERGTRRAVQELCEAFGYFVLLLGAVESLLYARAVMRETSVVSRPTMRTTLGPIGNEHWEERLAA